MPNGELRLVWADPDAKIAFEISGNAEYYIAEVGSEEEFEGLRRALMEAKQEWLQGN